MNITSTLFLFLFLPVILLAYYLCRNRRLRICLLLVASLFFYAWGDLKSLPILLLVIVGNWLFARLHSSVKNARASKLLLAFVVSADVALLLYYKYLTFLIGLLPQSWSAGIPAFQTLLPLGISFFIFKVISFQVDSYREPKLVQGGFLDYALYVSFFAQILSGPITRYGAVKEQLDALRPRKELFCTGAERFALGLIKKILIAEQVLAIANTAFGLGAPGAPLAWAGALSYTIQLYFDFSGYSDMAIGLAMFFGLLTPENFDHPYSAGSVQEFWRRWHISLSSWFRDYVYFPLGGSRCSVSRACLNTLIVFALTGLWHGANLTFLVWGIYHAVFLILERTALKPVLARTPNVLRRIYTLLAVIIGWIPFRAASLPDALTYIGCLFRVSPGDWEQLLQAVSSEKLTALVLGCAFAFPLWRELRTFLNRKSSVLYYTLLTLLLILGTCRLLEAIRAAMESDSDYRPVVHVCASSEVFGKIPAEKKPDTGIHEECPFHPASPYAISKVGTDLLGRYYAEAFGMTVMTTRMFTHTGPRRGDVFHESTFAKQIAMIEAGLIEPKVMVGNLKSLRTYADVRDAVRAYYMLVTVDPVPGEYYNIGGSYTCEVGDTLHTLISYSPMRDKIEVVTDPERLRPIDADLQIPDCRKFKAHTGWEPEIPFEKTMHDLLDYWRARVNRGENFLTR